MKLHTTIAALAGLLFMSGCVGKSYYVVSPEAQETVKGKLDGEWFTRTINDQAGQKAIELVYCPLQPGQGSVCRTAIVWARGHSVLIEGQPVAAPAAPEQPAPASEAPSEPAAADAVAPAAATPPPAEGEAKPSAAPAPPPPPPAPPSP